jgi:hypothetical protein
MNAAALINIYKQCCFPVRPYPRHFHRVGLPPVGHRLPRHRPRSWSDGVQHEVAHLFRFWTTFGQNCYGQSVLGGEEILG